MVFEGSQLAEQGCPAWIPSHPTPGGHRPMHSKQSGPQVSKPLEESVQHLANGAHRRDLKSYLKKAHLIMSELTKQTHEKTTELMPRWHITQTNYPLLSQVLKSYTIHGDDPIPNTWRCISKKNPKPAGTIWNHVDPISSTKSDGSSTFCSGISTL